MGLAQLWGPLFSGPADEIIFLITSNNHMADEINTIVDSPW